MTAILKFNFQKREQLRFSEVNYLIYTKKTPIVHVATTFSLKQGEIRTSHGPIPHPLKPKQGFQLILLNWGGDVGVFLWVWCVWGDGYICLYGWDVLEGWECIGKEGEEKLHHYIIFVTLSSLVHEKNSIPLTW